jgi:ABC-type bacteriocin/lantibiotic exporter with double-glycine peptidase domain
MRFNFFFNKKFSLTFVLFFLSLVMLNLLELFSLSIVLIFINYLIGIQHSIFSDFFYVIQTFNEKYFNINQTYFFLVIILAIFLIKTLFFISVTYLRELLSFSLANFFSYQLYNNYFAKHLNFFFKNSVYNIYRNIMSEVRKVSESFFQYIKIFSDIIVLIFIAFFTLMLNKNLFFLVIFVISPGIFLYLFLTKKITIVNSKKLIILRTKLIQTIIESSQLIFDIRFFNVFKKFQFFFLDKLNKYKESSVAVSVMNQLPRALNELIIIFAIIVVFFYLLLLNYKNLEIISIVSMFVIISLRVLPSINLILTSINKLKENKISFNIIKKDLFELPNNFIYKKINKIYKIQVSNISYRYGKKKIIRPISILFENFNIIGLKGKSGSGKTTFVKILLNILKVQKGSVTYNNYYKLDKKIFFNFSYIDNKSQLINGSIKENILFFSKLNDKKLKEVMAISCLSNEILTQNCKKNDVDQISTGQKQRVLLARSLYKSPSLIVMDEVLSNIDHATSVKIIKNLIQFQIPTILVSHNNSYLNYCDLRYEIINGKIYKI